MLADALPLRAAGKVKQMGFSNEDVLRTDVAWGNYERAGVISKSQARSARTHASSPRPS